MFPNETVFLVVDDAISMRQAIVAMLNELNYHNILEASDGILAWATLNLPNIKIQVILSDWNMPNMDGLEFLKKVRADNRFIKTPFIMFTTESEKPNIVAAINAGANNYITKPANTETIKRKLELTFSKLQLKME